MSNLITRSDFAAWQPATEDIEIPSFGTVRIREMSEHQRRLCLSEAAAAADTEIEAPERLRFLIRLVARSLVDEDGELLFTLADEDLQDLGRLSARVLGVLTDACLRLSRLQATPATAPAEGGNP